MQAAVAPHDISQKISQLEAEILQWEQKLALRVTQKGGAHQAVNASGEYDFANSAHYSATVSAQQAQNEMRQTGGSIQLVGEDAASEVIRRGATIWGFPNLGVPHWGSLTGTLLFWGPFWGSPIFVSL